MCRSAGDHFAPGFQDYVLAAVLVGEGGPIKDLQVVSSGSPLAPHVPCSSVHFASVRGVRIEVWRECEHVPAKGIQGLELPHVVLDCFCGGFASHQGSVGRGGRCAWPRLVLACLSDIVVTSPCGVTGWEGHAG
jgi:hypothetical protein